ncbi:transposase, partial [Pseudomonas aeruginosa]
TCLLPRGRSGGRGRLRLDLRVEEVITEVRLEFSRHRKEAKNHHAFAEIRNRCVRRGLIPPSHNTLRSRFAGVPARERVGLKYGKKVARERYEHIRGKTPETTFPLERIQIDHTLVDVVCASAFDREHVGRPWITIALDECTRAVLAFVLTWEYPNASTVAQCMTRVMTPKDEWLERVGVPLPWPMYGTPNSVYLDNAAEFWSRALFYGCREYGIAPPEHRPPGLVHFGGIIERFMGTAMDQMRLLPAATARDRGFDKVKTRNPNEAAEMTLDELEVWMLEFICGQYHVRPHSTTKQRPDLAWERGIYGTEKRAGAGLPPIIADKQKLYLDFADIEDRTIERYGMRWDNIEYWDEVLRPFLDAGEQRKFVVRRNPYDASRIYFLHPIEGTYCELRCEQITLPNVSVWEFNETRKRLVAQIGDKPDMATIMASMERQRLLEQDAQNAKKRHRSRLKQERRRVGEQVTAELTPHAPISEDAPPAPQAPVRRDIFYEIDE